MDLGEIKGPWVPLAAPAPIIVRSVSSHGGLSRIAGAGLPGLRSGLSDNESDNKVESDEALSGRPSSDSALSDNDFAEVEVHGLGTPKGLSKAEHVHLDR